MKELVAMMSWVRDDKDHNDRGREPTKRLIPMFNNANEFIVPMDALLDKDKEGKVPPS